jgi:phosphoribosylformylglycinamidine synthase
VALARARRRRNRRATEERDARWTLCELLSSPTIASKAWVYRQYDTSVRTNTMVGPGATRRSALRGTDKAMAVKTDCNGRYVYLEPRRAAHRGRRSGAQRRVHRRPPMAITNCLNFGNPERPSVLSVPRSGWRMADACEALGTPVTGGNVSLYNESPNGAVYPTPVIGMVGTDRRHRPRHARHLPDRRRYHHPPRRADQ